MQQIASVIVPVTALSGYAAHEVYESLGPNSVPASANWAEGQGSALASTGGQAAETGGASTLVSRLVGDVVTPEATVDGMYRPEDYARITRRRQLRQDCMRAKGYRFLGVPAGERL